MDPGNLRVGMKIKFTGTEKQIPCTYNSEKRKFLLGPGARIKKFTTDGREVQLEMEGINGGFWTYTQVIDFLEPVYEDFNITIKSILEGK